MEFKSVYFMNISTILQNTSITNETAEFFDVNSYLELMMGEKRRCLISVGILTFVYVLIFLTGLTGNICTCIVIARNGYMHTATNYYLLSLAVSDMLTLLIGLPTELYGIWESYPWPFGEPLCIFKSFLSEMTSYASVLTITAFTIERYVAICHPLRAQIFSSLSRAVKMVIAIWIVSGLFALPFPIHTRVFPYVTYNGTGLPDSLQCNIPFKWQHGMTYAFQISTFLFFVFPMSIIIIMYGLISAKLRRSMHESKHRTKMRTRKAVVRMLVAVVVAFFVQWAPFHAQRLMTSYIPIELWTPTLIQFQTYLFYVSGVLYFCNSTINPILYNVMSKKFRLAFKRTLCRCCYTAEELLELNGKAKFIYSSDRMTQLTTRHNVNSLSKRAFSDFNGIKHASGELLKPETIRETYHVFTGSKSHRCLYQHYQSTGRLNETYSDVDHGVHITVDNSNGFSPRAVGLRYQSETNSSSISFGELESDSCLEMKSLSSCSSSNILSIKLLAAPAKKCTFPKQSSFL